MHRRWRFVTLLAVVVGGCGDDVAPLVPDASVPVDAPGFRCVSSVEPSLVAHGTFLPTGIALDADNVYWADLFTDLSKGGGGIYRVAKAGGAVTPLYSVADVRGFGMAGLTYRAGALFWLESHYDPTIADLVERLRTMPASGGVASDVITARLIRFAVDDSHAYVTHFEDSRTVIERIPHGGAPERIGTTSGQVTALVADATDLYGITYSEAMWRMSKAGGDAIIIAPGNIVGRHVMVDTHRVYWLESGSGLIKAIPKIGGATTQIEVSPPVEVREWAAGLIEGSNLYLNAGGGILRLPTSGGNLAGVVCPASRTSVYAFAVDATRLFFVATEYGVAGSSVQAVDRR